MFLRLQSLNYIAVLVELLYPLVPVSFRMRYEFVSKMMFLSMRSTIELFEEVLLCENNTAAGFWQLRFPNVVS